MQQSFHKQMTEKVNHSVELVNELNMRLPWFFKQWNSTLVDRRAFVPLTEKSDVGDYIRTITDVQDVLKSHHMDMGELKQCEREMLTFVTEQFQVLVEAYDIQGRMIEALCSRLDVDVDLVLAEWALHNHKEDQYEKATGSHYSTHETLTVETREQVSQETTGTQAEGNNRLPFARK